MLLPYLKFLNAKKIILGSQSKTRNELLTAQRVAYAAIPSVFEENLDKQSFESPSTYNMATCRGKCEELLGRFEKQSVQWDLLICGDTIVQHKGVIIEKPENEQHCKEMVRGLANQTHRIYTAHAVIFNLQDGKNLKYEWVSTAEVTFGNISEQVLEYFAKQSEPYLHSGAYQLTAMSGSFIKEIKGSHTTVQGLEMYQVCNRIVDGGRQLKWFQ